jgi:hypothetical protein
MYSRYTEYLAKIPLFRTYIFLYSEYCNVLTLVFFLSGKDTFSGSSRIMSGASRSLSVFVPARWFFCGRSSSLIFIFLEVLMGRLREIVKAKCSWFLEGIGRASLLLREMMRRQTSMLPKAASVRKPGSKLRHVAVCSEFCPGPWLQH